jgi:hypothetical protein
LAVDRAQDFVLVVVVVLEWVLRVASLLWAVVREVCRAEGRV